MFCLRKSVCQRRAQCLHEITGDVTAFKASRFCLPISCSKIVRVQIEELTLASYAMATADLENLSLSAELRVPFPSSREAEIAHCSLGVDKEPKRGNVRRDLHVEGNIMQVHFQATEARTLRVSINSFFEHLKLVCQTIEKFGPPR